MSTVIDHLWRQVVHRPAHCLAPVAGSVNTPSEIANLELAVEAEKQVLWLDVSVDDALRVQVL